MSKYILSDLFKGDFPITQRYNENPQNYQMFLVPGHEGIDWGCPTGTEVLAPFDGIILRDTFGDKDYGNFTVVWDPIQHCAVWYCHLQDVTTSTGDKVTKGQTVGHTNNTGNSTGPHLHVNFVETDASGNRLNLDNGKQGFLDILDSNLIEWQLAGHMPNPTPPPIDTLSITDQTKIPQLDGQEVQAIKSSIAAKDQKISDLTTANNQQADMISSYTKEVSDLNGQIDTLRKQLSECQNKPPVGFPNPPKTSLGKYLYNLALKLG